MNIQDIQVGEQYRIVSGTGDHYYAPGTVVEVIQLDEVTQVDEALLTIRTIGLIDGVKTTQWVAPDHLEPIQDEPTQRHTPYDTGEIAEPKVWRRPSDKTEAEWQHWGKVDFENDEGATVATVQVVKRADGSYEVHVETYDSDTIVTKA